MRGRKAGSLLLFALLAGALTGAPARGDDAPPAAAVKPQQQKAQKPAPGPKKKKAAPAPDPTAPHHPSRTAAAANDLPLPALPGSAALPPLPGVETGAEASAALPLPDASAQAAAPPPRWLLKGRPATLLLEGAAEGTLVQVDGHEVGPPPLSLPPGAHEVRWSRPGFRPGAQRVRLKAGETLHLSLPLEAVAGVLADAPEAASAAPAPERVQVLVAAPPEAEPAEAPPLVSTTGQLFAEPRLPAEPAPAAGPAPAAPFAATSAAVAAPAAALAGPPPEANAATPIYKRWYFWGGAAVAATVVTVVIMAALPAQYVEKRDPAAACGGSCGIVVNRGP